MSVEDEQRFRLNARRRAMDLLARREHTRQELVLKLRTRLVTENPNSEFDCSQVIDQVLDQLEKDNLLSDARFIESYLTARKNKGYGPLYIRHQLRKKDVDEYGLNVVQGVDETQWLDSLQALVKKRLSTTGEFPQRGSKDYLKLQRFVLSRGFSGAQWQALEKRLRPGS